MNTNSSLTSKNWLVIAQDKLKIAGIETTRLDCLILLEDATKKDRGWLLAHPEYALQGSALKKLNAHIERRAMHEPLAYIRGKSEFYGREFLVTLDTLEPRPETETMIELFKKLVTTHQMPATSKNLIQNTDDKRQETRDYTMRVVDVGTGSGCLAITAKLEFPELEVIATDISPACLNMAEKNAKILGAEIQFFQGDLFDISEIKNLRSVTCILANLPYVPNSHTINRAAMHEPAAAIFGGLDGLDLYRRLFKETKTFGLKPVYIFTESLPFQHKELTNIAIANGYAEFNKDDFVQVFRARF